MPSRQGAADEIRGVAAGIARWPQNVGRRKMLACIALFGEALQELAMVHAQQFRELFQPILVLHIDEEGPTFKGLPRCFGQRIHLGLYDEDRKSTRLNSRHY